MQWAVAHGFRSSFRDWAAECSDAPREVCELALAPHEHERHRGGVPADGPVRAAACSHGTMGHVPRWSQRRVTTAAPPCPLVTVVTKATTAGKSARAGRPLERRPAYTVLNTVVWRGGRRPPSEPPASRAAAGATGGRGRRPQTPAAVRSPAQRRTVVVSARVLRADQAAFGEAQAHRLPGALEPGHEDVSGLGERWLDACVGSEDHAAAGAVAGRLLHSPRRRVRSLPAGMNRAGGAGWERPRTRSRRACISPDSGAVDRRSEGGSLPAPLSAQKRRAGFGSMRANRSGATGFREAVYRERGLRKGLRKGVSSYASTRVTPRVTPPRMNHSREPEATVCAWPGTTGRLPMLVGGPLPGRMTRGGSPGKASTSPSRRWSSRWRRAGQSFDGAIRSCRYPLRLGVAGHSGCAARGDVHYWRSRIKVRLFNDLQDDRSGPAGRVPV